MNVEQHNPITLIKPIGYKFDNIYTGMFEKNSNTDSWLEVDTYSNSDVELDYLSLLGLKPLGKVDSLNGKFNKRGLMQAPNEELSDLLNRVLSLESAYSPYRSQSDLADKVAISLCQVFHNNFLLFTNHERKSDYNIWSPVTDMAIDWLIVLLNEDALFFLLTAAND